MTDNNSQRPRTFVNRDFDGFKNDFLRSAQRYFPSRVKDLSENGFAGLVADWFAAVGDNLSYYLDWNLLESSPVTVRDPVRLNQMLKASGLTVRGVAPATAIVDFYIEVPAAQIGGRDQPLVSALPIIQAGTSVIGKGIIFNLQDDLDFGAKDEDQEYLAEIKPSKLDSNGNATFLSMKRSGVCVSGEQTTESFVIDSNPTSFLTLTLSNEDVSSIISVRDTNGFEYYPVGNLAESVVWERIPNYGSDSDDVPFLLRRKTVTRRYVREYDIDTGLTSIRFGNGLDGVNTPDISMFSLPYTGSTVTRQALSPATLLASGTFGILPKETTIIVTYRTGGGKEHNVVTGAISDLQSLLIDFPRKPAADVARGVRNSIDVDNPSPAAGGADAPTPIELRRLLNANKTTQDRIVTPEDLLSRIYNMPTQYGVVTRAGVRPNPDNPLSVLLYVLSRDRQQKLTFAPDSLKRNLAQILNAYRLTGDAIDILDASIVNVGIRWNARISVGLNKPSAIAAINGALIKWANSKRYEIDEAINIDEIRDVIRRVSGVESVGRISFEAKTGTNETRSYPGALFDMEGAITAEGVVVPPPGGIFEIRFPEYDIQGSIA